LGVRRICGEPEHCTRYERNSSILFIGIHHELRDGATGNLLATYDPMPDPDSDPGAVPRDAPRWVAALALVIVKPEIVLAWHSAGRWRVFGPIRAADVKRPS
jgi:hypothetical protein